MCIGEAGVVSLARVELAVGEWMDDNNALRADGLGAEILGQALAAASMLGTFLRAFTVGHVRQVDAVQEDLHDRAWGAGARAKEPALKLDLHSTVSRPTLARIRRRRLGEVVVRADSGFHVPPPSHYESAKLCSATCGWGRLKAR